MYRWKVLYCLYFITPIPFLTLSIIRGYYGNPFLVLSTLPGRRGHYGNYLTTTMMRFLLHGKRVASLKWLFNRVISPDKFATLENRKWKQRFIVSFFFGDGDTSWYTCQWLSNNKRKSYASMNSLSDTRFFIRNLFIPATFQQLCIKQVFKNRPQIP